ncbi:MAG: arsenate reductase ArsC [Planctomycetota bacterium]|nr:arsenate reductase ArsC [Planctomycetota bacterium]
MQKNPVLLFLCTGNAARSQMAEALMRHHAGDRYDVHSAGTKPKGVHPLTLEALKDKDIETKGLRSKHLDEYLGHLPVHTLIVVCSSADQECPVAWPNLQRRLFWPFEDPAAAEGSDTAKLAKFREVRDQIEAKIVDWLKEDTL